MRKGTRVAAPREAIGEARGIECLECLTAEAIVQRARALAAARGWTVAQVGLAYLFSQPFPVSAVVAASTPEKMRENLAAASLRLTAGEVEALEA